VYYLELMLQREIFHKRKEAHFVFLVGDFSLKSSPRSLNLSCLQVSLLISEQGMDAFLLQQ
jgi:hypothetical protein